ncbi:hypothetical protein KIH39_21415 [Telmatocola sphagniphila]|uniref:Uncharacterized protein n=1 Tax=Telmatocola sphagniphila TaxID=1123043 RepID=A0A8E6B3A2_9BACT|nr:hypothetical protein [Telmatocola sphagniphila]QVL31380.1 hypothetical protein KIH39_21415 [Telmatocola sphagniphila]
MFLERWLRLYSQALRIRKKKALQNPKKPESKTLLKLQALDDRIVPNASRLIGIYPDIRDLIGSYSSSTTANSVVTHFAVITSPQTTAGAAREVEIIALNANNRPVSNYTGTVQITSSDSAAVLPATYTFTAADHGRHEFSVILNSTGSETITATDTSTSTLSGSTSVTVNPALVATHFALLTQKNVYSGAIESVTVVALDASNRVVPNYTGTIQFSTAATGVTLPANYTFTSADQGVHTFQITSTTIGSETLTATDTASPSITGSVTVNVKADLVATHFALIQLPSAYGSTTAQYLVVALDANNRVVPTYTGTIHFTSTDSGATLPADYTFTLADGGSHVFSVTYSSAATKSTTVTVIDTTNSSLTGSSTNSHRRDNFVFNFGW